MDKKQPVLKTTDYIFIIAILAFLTPLLLFVLRSFDDNRLTSWKWIFTNAEINIFILILIPAIAFSYGLSRISFSRYKATFLFFASFLIAAVFWREAEVIVDTSRYFIQAKYLELYGIRYFIEEWGKDINIWTDLPVAPFFYGLIFRFFGETRLYIQIFTTTLFSLTVLLTYMIGKSLWDEDTGLYAGILLLGIPYLFTQVPLMLVDVLTMFFVTLSIFTFIKAMERGGYSMIIFSSIAVTLTFFSKYSTWLMLSVLAVIFAVYIIQGFQDESPDSGPKTREYLFRGGLVALISGLLIGAIFIYKYDIFTEQLGFIMIYQKPGLKRWGESFLSTFFFQIHPFISLAALYSVYSAFRRKDCKYVIVIWLIVLIFIFQIRRIRYVIPLFPMVTLMASYGLRELNSKQVKKFIVWSAVTTSLVLAFYVHLPFMENISMSNLKRAGEYLNRTNEQYMEVFSLKQGNSGVNPAISVPILDLFTSKRVIFKYNENAFQQPFEKIEKSSLRFTWEYKNPKFYETAEYSVENSAIVVISGDAASELPVYIKDKIKGRHLDRVFKTDNRVFRFRTMVRIYRTGPGESGVTIRKGELINGSGK